MVGHVTDRSATIWVRTADAVNVQIVARVDGDSSTTVRTKTVLTTAATDFTAALTIRGLAPQTRYVYDVRVEGRGIGSDPLPFFRTAPTPGRSAKLTFAFGGGAAYIPRNRRMWDTIAAYEPQLLLLLGDNVYIDDPQDEDYQRYIYYRRQSQPSFRRLVEATPVYSIWDDHDFGTDNCAGGPDIDDPAWKPRVWDLFRENWVNPGYGQGSVYPGCWYDFLYGDIHLILLDGRYYRTPERAETDEMPTMLGPVQRQWLLQTLKRSPARIKLLASPVPWIGGNRDKWNGFAEERQQIFEQIAAEKIEGVVLLSADRHRSDLLVTYRPQGYDLYEFMSSRLTNHHRHGEIDEREGALFSYNKKCSFGLVTIDTRPDDPCILYRIVSIDREDDLHISPEWLAIAISAVKRVGQVDRNEREIYSDRRANGRAYFGGRTEQGFLRSSPVTGHQPAPDDGAAAMRGISLDDTRVLQGCRPNGRKRANNFDDDLHGDGSLLMMPAGSTGIPRIVAVLYS